MRTAWNTASLKRGSFSSGKHGYTPAPAGARHSPQLGGIGRRGARCLRFLARRASCRKRGRDGTRYSRFHPENYLSHHLAGIVTAAVFADARHIVEEITLLKTRVNGATPAAAAADPTE